jgi:beta-RFAP synthase
VEAKLIKIYIKTPARLHLGLIDMNGDLGRLFGGLGVGIDHPNVIVEAQTATDFKITGEKTELAKEITDRFFTKYPYIQPKVHLNIVKTIPCHTGLGSGTQLALALAVALAKISSVKASIPELATAVGRAKRTSVGTSIFEYGGFVVDGGKNPKTQVAPPLIYHKPFPEDWCFIVASPNQPKGLSSSEENHAFDKLTTMPAQDVSQICRLIMLKLLPAIAEHDIENFGEALTKIQILTGNHFAQAQGGTYAKPAATKCIEFMKQQGAYGTGQSSWGPALYAIVKQQQATSFLTKVQTHLKDDVGGDAFIAKANNQGATIKVEA